MSTTTMERCEAVPGGMIQCREIVVGYFNTKAADGRLRDFPLCQVHLDAWRQADRRDEEQKAQKHEQERVDRAREAFVTAWQSMYIQRLWSEPWTCPLCRKVVQLNPLQESIVLPVLIEQHQENHGKAWTDYMAISAQREAASQGEGG